MNLEDIDESDPDTFKASEHFDSNNVQFCWNCGANIQPGQTQCESCRAPLKEHVKEKILQRTEPVQGVKCWKCEATTSGNVCGVCGAPLTKEGLKLIKDNVQVQKEVSKDVGIKVIAPQINDLKSIDLTLEELNEIVSKHVTIVESQVVQEGIARIIIERPENESTVLSNLRHNEAFEERNLKVLIREVETSPGNAQIMLQFYYWKPESTKERYSLKNIAWNIGLFLATIVTVSLAGWTFVSQIYETYNFQGNLALDISLFTISLMGILTIHELGHFTISRLKKVDVSLPYFIPVPSFPAFPTLGTFGALIRQKEPVETRDDLFDIGIAGPIAGFIVALPLLIIGFRLTYIVDIPPDFTFPTEEELINLPTIPLNWLLERFSLATGIFPYYDVTTQIPVQHPVAFAGYIGLILTGLNLMPVGQLDGGHTARAVFGDKTHRIVTLVIGLLLILNPFTRFFGILILVFSMFQRHPGPVDDVSPVSKSKYVYIVIGYIVGFACLPLPINQILSYF